MSNRLLLVVLVIVTGIASTHVAALVRPVVSANKIAQQPITLITGDVAIFDISQTQSIVHARLSDPSSTFISYVKNTQVYLIPSHAQALIAQGIVDTELFNVSKLVSLNLDDRNSQYLPVLVKFSVADQRLEAGVDSQFYPAINTQFIRLDKTKLAQTWQQLSTNRVIKSITLDKQIPHH